MNEDFLHRLRARPSPEFLARLKSRLDRQPLRPRAALVRTVLAAVLAGTSAWALASFALRGEFAGLHWPGWVHREAGSARTDGSSTAVAPRQTPQNGWVRNPWAPAGVQAPTVRSQKRGGSSGVAPIVPDGVAPSQQTISDGSYPGSRTMYLYVNQHQTRRLATLPSFLLSFLKPLDTDWPAGINMTLGRAERAQILVNTFEALGYPPPLAGEQR